MYHLAAMFIGAVVAALISCLLIGPSSTGTCVTLLVVCTGGLGLIPLLLGSYLVGLLVLGLTGAALHLTDTPPEPVPRERVEVLAGYVLRARQQGLSAAAIEASASEAGWTRTEIQEALERSSS